MPARSMRFNAGAAASVAAKVVSLPEFVKTYQETETNNILLIQPIFPIGQCKMPTCN
jgi:hypothetical protein